MIKKTLFCLALDLTFQKKVEQFSLNINLVYDIWQELLNLEETQASIIQNILKRNIPITDKQLLIELIIDTPPLLIRIIEENLNEFEENLSKNESIKQQLTLHNNIVLLTNFYCFLMEKVFFVNKANFFKLNDEIIQEFEIIKNQEPLKKISIYLIWIITTELIELSSNTLIKEDSNNYTDTTTILLNCHKLYIKMYSNFNKFINYRLNIDVRDDYVWSNILWEKNFDLNMIFKSHNILILDSKKNKNTFFNGLIYLIMFYTKTYNLTFNFWTVKNLINKSYQTTNYIIFTQNFFEFLENFKSWDFNLKINLFYIPFYQQSDNKLKLFSSLYFLSKKKIWPFKKNFLSLTANDYSNIGDKLLFVIDKINSTEFILDEKTLNLIYLFNKHYKLFLKDLNISLQFFENNKTIFLNQELQLELYKFIFNTYSSINTLNKNLINTTLNLHNINNIKIKLKNLLTFMLLDKNILITNLSKFKKLNITIQTTDLTYDVNELHNLNQKIDKLKKLIEFTQKLYSYTLNYDSTFYKIEIYKNIEKSFCLGIFFDFRYRMYTLDNSFSYMGNYLVRYLFTTIKKEVNTIHNKYKNWFQNNDLFLKNLLIFKFQKNLILFLNTVMHLPDKYKNFNTTNFVEEKHYLNLEYFKIYLFFNQILWLLISLGKILKKPKHLVTYEILVDTAINWLNQNLYIFKDESFTETTILNLVHNYNILFQDDSANSFIIFKILINLKELIKNVNHISNDLFYVDSGANALTQIAAINNITDFQILKNLNMIENTHYNDAYQIFTNNLITEISKRKIYYLISNNLKDYINRANFKHIIMTFFYGATKKNWIDHLKNCFNSIKSWNKIPTSDQNNFIKIILEIVVKEINNFIKSDFIEFTTENKQNLKKCKKINWYFKDEGIEINSLYNKQNKKRLRLNKKFDFFLVKLLNNLEEKQKSSILDFIFKLQKKYKDHPTTQLCDEIKQILEKKIDGKNIKILNQQDIDLLKSFNLDINKNISENFQQTKLPFYIESTPDSIEWNMLSNDIDFNKTINALRANLVHSFDAKIARSLVSELDDIVSIHDAFGIKVYDIEYTIYTYNKLFFETHWNNNLYDIVNKDLKEIFKKPNDKDKEFWKNNKNLFLNSKYSLY